MRCIVAGVLALSLGLPAHAQSFYEGKTITIVTSTGVGGTYDVTARLIARHMPRFIPGKPTMVVQNMPGGGNVLATNFMYAIAPKDGTSIATVHNAMPLHQVLGGQGVTAAAAVAIRGHVLEAAVVAHRVEVRAALTAEAARRGVVVAAGGADHAPPPPLRRGAGVPSAALPARSAARPST